MKGNIDLLNEFTCYPGAINDPYLLLPIKKKSDSSDDCAGYYNYIHILVFCRSNNNTNNKSFIPQFPYEFQYRLCPLKTVNEIKFHFNSKSDKDSSIDTSGLQKISSCAFKHITQIVFVPGYRKSPMFIIISSEGNQHYVNLYMFDPQQPPTSASLDTNIKDFRRPGTDNYMAISPSKTFLIQQNQAPRKILFASDERHFFLVQDKLVSVHHIESVDLSVDFITFSDECGMKIVDADNRNDILQLSVIYENNFEIMFFDFQSKPKFKIGFKDKSDTPTFSIVFEKSLLSSLYKISADDLTNQGKFQCYPQLIAQGQAKSSTQSDSVNDGGKGKVLEDSIIYTNETVIFVGCKYLPGDNDYISIVLNTENAEKKRTQHVIFFKLRCKENEKLQAFDVREMRSILTIQDREIKSEVNPVLSNFSNFARWSDMVGNDDEFEFIYVYSFQLLVRFHFFSSSFAPQSLPLASNTATATTATSTMISNGEDRKPVVQMINILNYKEEDTPIFEDKQSKTSFMFLPPDLKSKVAQQKAFEAAKTPCFNWVKIFGNDIGTHHVITIDANSLGFTSFSLGKINA